MNSLLQGYGRPSSFTYYFRPIIRLAERINTEVSKTLGVSKYDCVSDRIKAETIAGNLIRDWQFAKLLVESFGWKVRRDFAARHLFQPDTQRSSNTCAESRSPVSSRLSAYTRYDRDSWELLRFCFGARRQRANLSRFQSHHTER